MQSKILVVISVLVAVLGPLALLPSDADESTSRCLSILILSAIWWIFEPFPSYVTSLAIVPLCVSLGLLDSVSASSAFFDPVMFLFITGFSLAAAMERYRLTQKISHPIMHLIMAGTRRGGEAVFYLGISGLCVLLCCLVSNVAASVLVTALGQSVAQNLDLEKNSRKRLFLTIAFACNVGGMLVPIASPQNIVAIAAAEDTSISFTDWFVFALPVCLCTLVVIYLVLRHQFGESSILVNRPTELVEMGETPPASPASGSEWSWQQVTVTLILVATVTGWCMFEYLKDFFGHMGIYGSVGVVVLHASGLLTSADWQGLPWPVLTLMGGGMVLGEAVSKSGLLSVISDSITTLFPPGSSPWIVFLLFQVILCFVANFLSSTVCALISVPIIAKIGSVFGHSKLFVIGSTLMISAAMCLPVSSFPNANSAAVTDKSKPLLRVSDFTKTGFSIGIFFLIYMVTVGYWTGLALNH